jgi:DNA-directed RNA polymerase subunit M/transcription elongation factor TFIIS
VNDILKKRISIGVSICCLSLAIGITVKRNFIDDYGGGSIGPIQMLCVNPKCGQAFELSEKEFSNLISQNQGSDMLVETPAFKCVKCNQKSAYIAMKCEKCGNVFVPNYQSPDGFDKCPKCGFSKSQQEQK